MTKHATPARLLSPLLPCLLLTTCMPGETGIPDMDGHPVSIAYWKERDHFPVGSFQGRRLHGISATSADVTIVHPPSASGPRTALRLAIDEARKLLWVLDLGAAYVYSLGSDGPRVGSLLARIPVGVYSKIRKGSCFSDMILDETGRALVSSNLRPMLAEVTLEAGPSPRASVRHIELIVGDRDRRHLTGVTAIAVLPAEDALVVADARTGALWRVERATWKATRIVVPGGVEGACALLPVAANRDRSKLIMSRGFGGGVQVVELPARGDRGHLGRTLVTADRLVFGLARRDGIVAFPIGRRMGRHDAGGSADSKPMLAAVAVDAGWRCNVPLDARDGRNSLCRANGFAGGSLR